MLLCLVEIRSSFGSIFGIGNFDFFADVSRFFLVNKEQIF